MSEDAQWIPRTIGDFLVGHIDLRDFSIDITGNNDSTSAVQSAVDQADATGWSSTIWVPPCPRGGGIHLAGPIIATNGANSQVVLPSADNTGAHAPVILFKGMGIPYYQQTGGFGIFTTSATNGYMFGIGGPSTSPAQSLIQGGYFSYSVAHFEDLVFLTGTNPTMGALNLGRAFAAQVLRCQVLNGYAAPSGPATASTSQVGITMPYCFNGGPAWNRLEDTTITGQYCGAEVSEHTKVRMFSSFNRYGLRLGAAEHLIEIEELILDQTIYGLHIAGRDIYPTGAVTNTTRIKGYMSLEQDGSGPWTGGATFYDPNNYGGGTLEYCVNHNDDVHGAFTQTGGTGVVVTSLSPGGANP